MRSSLDWQVATVKAIRPETPNVKTFTFDLPAWAPHRPGQHCDVRLTAEDGYQAQRSYSVASEPERTGEIELTIERIEAGEVSPFFHDVVVPGDRIEVRGPIGGYFVWEANQPEPLLLVAGGSGVVPLMSMLRHRATAKVTRPARLLYSSRTFGDILYFDELAHLQDGLMVFHTLTRAHPAGWKGYTRRIDQEMLAEVASPLGPSVQAFVCGPTRLVESVADGLSGLGLPPAQIRTERFGPTNLSQGG
jgi:ferredoxin-NADP reductase